jgi:stromal membrane-associated protein
VCVDPRWVSVNIGIFLCIGCAGIHRSLGAHISKVRSVDLDVLDNWMLETLTNVGNRRANEIYEFRHSEVVKYKPKPTDDYYKKKTFIILKYKQRTFANPAILQPLSHEVGRTNESPENSIPNPNATSSSLSTSESVSYEGWLTKQGNNYKSWRLRWFVLKNGTLSYFRSRGAAEPAGCIDLSTAQGSHRILLKRSWVELN